MTRPPFRLPALKIFAAFALVAAASALALALKSRAVSPPAPAAPRAERQGERLEVEYLTLRQNGFDPAEITRPHGRFVLAVSNWSKAEEVEVRLERLEGGRLRAARLSRRKRNWSDAVDLPPGQYVLTEANNPAWKCLITITPRGN